MTSALQQRLRDDSGLSLIELIVAIALSMVVLTAILNLLDSTGRAGARIDDKAETVARARIAMDRVTRILRSQACASATVPPVVSGDGSSVTFYSDTNTGTTFAPRRITLSYASGAITQATFVPTNTAAPWAYPPTATTTRTLATGISQNGATPVFAYYSWSNLASAVAVPLSTTTTGTLAANSIAKIVKVDVSFKASALSGRVSSAGQTAQTSTVYTRNADFSGAADPGRVWGPRCG